jgi:hypothetical protein
MGLSETFSLFFCFFFILLFCCFAFSFVDLSVMHFLANAETALSFSAWRTLSLFASSSSSSEK